jgi:hypothetical protein
LAINKTFLLTEIADEVNDYGEWDPEEGGFLENKLHDALDDLWQAAQWAYRFATEPIATTSGTLGPYPASGDLPADFDRLVAEEKVNKYFAYDAYGVPPPIPDDSFGQRYPIVFDRTLAKIRFLVDPGTGTKTLYYLKKLPEDIDDILALLPNERSLKKFLRARASHYALAPTEDFAAQAKVFWDQSEMFLTREKLKLRKGSTRQDTRTLLGPGGNPVYYGLQGDVR